MLMDRIIFETFKFNICQNSKIITRKLYPDDSFKKKKVGTNEYRWNKHTENIASKWFC